MSTTSDTNTCDYTYDRVIKLLHTLMVISNFIYFMSGIVAYLSGFKVFGMLFIVISIISTIYHSGYDTLTISNDTWHTIDTVFSTSVTVSIVLYALYQMYLLYTSGNFTVQKKIIFINVVILNGLGILMFVLAVTAERNFKVQPDDLTIFAHPQKNIQPDWEQRRKNLNYMVYHILWHVFSSIGVMVGITLMH